MTINFNWNQYSNDVISLNKLINGKYAKMSTLLKQLILRSTVLIKNTNSNYNNVVLLIEKINFSRI